MGFDYGVIRFSSCASPQYYLDKCYLLVLLAKLWNKLIFLDLDFDKYSV